MVTVFGKYLFLGSLIRRVVAAEGVRKRLGAYDVWPRDMWVPFCWHYRDPGSEYVKMHDSIGEKISLPADRIAWLPRCSELQRSRQRNSVHLWLSLIHI